jgi:hypothetical protein
MRRFLAAGLLLLSVVSLCAAQDEKKQEFGVTVGRTFISDQTVPNTSFFNNTVHSGKGLSFNFSYAHALQRYKWGSLSIEIPLLWNPDVDLNFGQNVQNVVPADYSSLFFTPSARVRFLEGMAFEPWVSFGGGVGHFVASKNLIFNGATNPGHRIKTTGVLNGGVGFDVPLGRKFRNVIFRFEARDNWSGVPPINVDTGKTRQHNLYVGGGAVFAF